MINTFITDICTLLHIAEPIISYDTSNFQSDTMMAQCDSSGTTIYLNKERNIDPDYFFAIAHELRHIWQISTDKTSFFCNYQTVDMLNIEQYNNQFAEVDANAFAGLVMICFFHIKPLWHGLSDSTIQKINERMIVISSVFDV